MGLSFLTNGVDCDRHFIKHKTLFLNNVLTRALSGILFKKFFEATAMSDSLEETCQSAMVGVSVSAEAVDISAMMSALGDLGVPPPKLYRIGEVVQYSGFSRQTVHNYTAMGLIRESQWTQTGHRLYDPGVFRYLALIKQLRSRFSLAQIKQMLDQSPVS
jgi:hypothetical protein